MANCVWKLRQTESQLHYQIIGELPYPEKCPFAEVRMKVPAPMPTPDPDPPTKPKKSSKVKTIHQKSSSVLYPDSYYESLLKSYFRLDVDLEQHYATWSLAHKHFQTEAGQFYAIRQLNQEPVENLFSFICSQNNNISRLILIRLLAFKMNN